MRLLIAFLLLMVAVVGLRLMLRLLNPLPPLEPRPYTLAIADTEGTRLGREAAPLVAARPGLNGVFALPDAQDSLAARIAIARAAERSIDAQYYIWNGDISGNLLAQALIDAADRGVRVRLLLDDNGTAGLDRQLAALDRHPLVEVRLFNPFVIRRPKFIGYLMDFGRLNRRMHNKAFIADNQAVVVGGRNVGDEYFGATDGALFEDLDVFAIGPVVRDVSADFDLYWASRSSYPVSAILPKADAAELARLRAGVAQAAEAPLARRYAAAIDRTLIAREGPQDALPLEWVKVQMLSDDPAKGLDEAPRGGLLAEQMVRLLGTPQRRLTLVSAYFVPTGAGTNWFAQAARRGVDVSILTNALEATDVAAVHAGYAPHRPTLLAAGVRLQELKAEPGHRTRLKLGFGSGSASGSGGGTGFGSRPSLVASSSALHAKTFAVDGERIFIGSFNFDPRSVALNTELGFLIESPAMAQGLDRAVAAGTAEAAYEVRLGAGGRLEWVDRSGGRVVVHQVEPGTQWHQRALVTFLSWLPIDGLL